MGRNDHAMGSAFHHQHSHSNRKLYLLCAYLIIFILLSIFGGCETNRTHVDLRPSGEITLESPVIRVTRIILE